MASYVLVNSCLVPALAAHGHSVQTVESFTHHSLAQAFHECGAAQCGICTPGMLLAGVKILQDHPQATEAEIREGLAGNLCRCTGYSAIVAAVKKVQQP
jgi:carbon-monoxide dehydrogenase small subunit